MTWNVWVLLLILSLLGTAIWVLTPSGSTSLDREKDNWGMRLGLDLAGGSHLVYQADFQEDWSDGEKEFYLGYGERLEHKLRHKNAQITRTERLLKTLPEEQKPAFEALLEEAKEHREEIQRELDELYAILDQKKEE